MSVPFDEVSGDRRDPDPFVVLNFLLNCVMAVAQVVQATAAVKQGQSTGSLDTSPTSFVLGMIDDAAEKTVTDCEKLIRFISRAQGSRGAPPDQPFAFGASGLLLSQSEMTEFERLADGIAGDATLLNGQILRMIQHSPSFSADLGRMLLSELKDLDSRINNLYRGSKTNGQVLDECLAMMRVIHGLTRRLRGN